MHYLHAFAVTRRVTGPAGWSHGDFLTHTHTGDQIENAKAYATKTGFDNLLDFQVGDHHKRFNYSDNSFDGAYSFQAVWPFFKTNELDFTAREIYRVLKPGGRFLCLEF